jgi:RNA polymerase sigma factor (sigma-70 family)
LPSYPADRLRTTLSHSEKDFFPYNPSQSSRGKNRAPGISVGGTTSADTVTAGERDMGDSRAERVLGQLHHWLVSRSMPSDDGQLLERFVQQRDEEAFAELVARHGPLVYGLCRRLLGHMQDAEDVFQATFLVLARKAAAIRKPPSLSCWLHGVAYRLALKARAETERRRFHEQQAQPLCATEDADLSWREVRGLLDEELQRLPEKQRLPLVLCYLEGLTQDEAARRLGWPRGTLKRRLEAGRERLRLRLTRRGVTLGAGLFAAALTDSAIRGAVPLALRQTTVRASIRFVTNETAALAATPAALLAKGALQTMLTTKLKLGALAIVLLGCAVTAAGLAIPQAPSEKQPEKKAEAPLSTSIKAGEPRPAEAKQRHEDRQGDPLPEGAIARLGTLRMRHADTVWSVVFTRDSKTAIAGDTSGNIVYWDVATGREIRRFSGSGPGNGMSALTISPDGKVLASAGTLPGPAGQGLYLWDVETGKLRFRDTLKANQINHLLFTLNGKTLVLEDYSNIIRLWNVEQRKVTHELKGHTGNISTLAVSPDGKTLASGSWKDPHVRLWDIASGTEKRHFAACDSDVLGVAFSPDGKTLAAVGNGAPLTFFDPNTGKRLRKAESGGSHALYYAPDGKTLFGVSGFYVLILDAESGKHLRRIHAPRHFMNRLAFSPNGKILATFLGGSHTFDLWDVASGKLLNPIPGHRNYITALAFSADGRQVFSASGIMDIPVQAWDARTGERLYELDNNNPNSVIGLALSPDGKLLAACGYNDNTIRLWDLASRKEVRVFKGHTVSISTVAWSADGKTLASADWHGKSPYIWDAATGKERWKKEVHFDWPSDIALSPDGKNMAVGGFLNGMVRIWSLETGKDLRSISTPHQIVYSLAFSLDGSTLFTCGISGAIHLWDAASGRLVGKWDTKSNWISQLALTRDGRTLVTGHDDGSVRLWEVATGKERARFQGPRVSVRAVAISRDGRRVASGGNDTTILVWDATGGTRPDAALSANQLQTLWRDLGEADARRAYRALWRMALSPKQALPFLAEHLRPIAPLDAAQQKRVDRLVADLDSDRFAVRQEAEAALEKMGATVEPALHKALESKPSLEVRQRIEKVLDNLASERLRIQRALEAIEHMNTPDARRFVDSLANGAPRAWLTEEAAAIRRRWIESSRTD